MPTGPWNSRPPSWNPQQPDFEEQIQRAQEALRKLFSGGHFGGGGIAMIALAALALWGASGFFRVQPDERGVVLRFGKIEREVQPGLNYGPIRSNRR